jgi:multidrug efflux system outer membrane protein
MDMVSSFKRFGRRGLTAAVLAVVVTACTPARDYVGPTFPFFNKYTTTKAGAAKLLTHDNWWRRMKDPVLDKLVVLALSESLSLKLAQERVSAARTERRVVPLAANVTSSASVRAEGTGSDGPDLASRGDVGLNWLFDPWGARREQLRAADARIDIAEAELDAARLLVLYNLSNAYIDLRFQQRQLVLAQQELSRGTQALNLINERAAAQVATRQDVTRARARLASVRAQMPALQAAAAARVNEIAVLSGHIPGQLPAPLAAALQGHGTQPHAHMPSDIGIPADLLRNRPDLWVAERRYYVALAQVEVARAALYPTLSLTGLISLDDVGSSRPEYYIGPSVRFPSLPLSTARASVELRHSEVRQAHESWKSDILTAILQVENALLEYAALHKSLSSAREATRLYRESAALTRKLLEQNDATISDLLESQDEVAAAAGREAELRFRHAQSFVELNVRLGAGHAGSSDVASEVTQGVRRDDTILTAVD